MRTATYQWGSEILLAATLGMPLRPPHIFCERVLVDSEVECRAPGSNSKSEVGVSRFGSGEEHKMGNAQRTAHGNVIAKSVGLSLLQPCRGTGLHDSPDIGSQLTDAGSYLAGANANDHALGIFAVGMAVKGGRRHGVLGTDVGSLLDSFPGHFECGVVIMCGWVICVVKKEVVMMMFLFKGLDLADSKNSAELQGKCQWASLMEKLGTMAHSDKNFGGAGAYRAGPANR